MDVITESAITLSPSEEGAQGKVEKKSGKRIGYHYIILKSLKESQKNDVVKCLYIKGLFNFGFCVIKEGTYGDTKDDYGRDIRDRLIWQQQLHADLQGKLRLPKLLGSFEENGNYYLVMEYVKGKNLNYRLKKHREELRYALLNGGKVGWEYLSYLEQIAGLLEIIHQQQYVHRDVTPANFVITPRGQVHVIDMELSYSLAGVPSPPFQWGTLGYMSPNQKVKETPVIEDDIFSLGAIILQVLGGIHPIKVTGADGPLLPGKVYFFIRDKKIADLVLQCLQPEVTQRPNAGIIRQALHEYRGDFKKRKTRPVSIRPTPFEKEQISGTLQQVIDTLSTPWLADDEKGWFSESVHSEQNNNSHTIEKAWYASFALGASGVIYLLGKASNAGLEVGPAASFLNKGIELIERKYVNHLDIVSPSLYFGTSGIAVSLATAVESGFLINESRYTDWISSFLQINNPDINYENGISGQGLASLACSSFVNPDILHQQLQQYANILISQQQPDGSWIKGGAEKSKETRKTKVFSTGIAGILYFLLEYGRLYSHQPALEASVQGLQWLMKRAVRSNNTVEWIPSGDKLRYGYLEGNAGIALTFLKAYQELGNSLYKDYAKGALLSIDPELIDDNLSQGTGLSGLGEVYLDAFLALQEEEWLKRADWIAQLVMRLGKEHKKYGPYWLIRNEKQPIPNFMTGNSGVLHFLLRYCYPESTSFPLMT